MQFLFLKGRMLQWAIRSSPDSLYHPPAVQSQISIHPLFKARETRFGWPLWKSRRKHFLGNNIEPLVSYLCPFQLWSSGGTSPCTERRSCRWRQRPASEHGHRCEDPCRSGISVQTWAGLDWASLQSVSLQSYSAPCWGQPNGWHLQRKTNISEQLLARSVVWSRISSISSHPIRQADVKAISTLAKKTLFTFSH